MTYRMIIVSVLIGSLAWVSVHSHTIGLYDDNAGISCNITDGLGLKPVHVVHVVSGGATASQFSAPKPACWTNATYLSDAAPWLHVGNSQTGMAIGYGACRTGSVHVITINYFVQGSSPACCGYPLLADPAPWAGGEVLVVDCNNNTVIAEGLVSTINGDATCPCAYPVPVEETTWGQVKALYSE